jgi:hypothetical protein
MVEANGRGAAHGDDSAVSRAESASGAPVLRSLGAKAPPTDLAVDLRRLLGLPTAAVGKLWTVLLPSLDDPLPPEAASLLDMFSAAYGVDPDALASPIRAIRFLYTEVARNDIDEATLAADLALLCPDEPLVHELVLAGFQPAKDRLRKQMLQAALADHGNLLIGARWRLDMIQASERGRRLSVPVAILTLQYMEGSEKRRITVQALPDMMGELKTICEQVLG